MSDATWWDRLPKILIYPVSVTGILMVVFLGVMTWIGRIAVSSGFTTMFGSLIIAGLFFSTIFAVIRSSANGSTALPEMGNYTNVVDDLVLPGLKATVLGIALYLPSILIVLFYVIGSAVSSPDVLHGSRRGHAADAAQLQTMLEQFQRAGVPPPPELVDASHPKPAASPRAALAFGSSAEPVKPSTASPIAAILGAIALAIGATLIYPLSLIVLAISRSLLVALNPVVWIQILGQVAVPYAGVLLGIVAIGLVGGVISLPFQIASNWIPVFPAVIASVVNVYFAICTAHLLGWFVWQYRARLGFTPDVREELSVERVRAIKQATLDELAKRGPVKGAMGGGIVRVGAAAGNGATAAPAPQPVAAQPVATGSDLLPPSQGEIDGLSARFASACAARDLEAAGRSAPLLLDLFWGSGAFDRVREIHQKLLTLDPDFSLDPLRQNRLAKELEESQAFEAAAGAWRALALKHPQHPGAPRALIRCAECYAKAGRADIAKKGFEVLIARYPMSELVALAQQRIKALGSPK